MRQTLSINPNFLSFVKEVRCLAIESINVSADYELQQTKLNPAREIPSLLDNRKFMGHLQSIRRNVIYGAAKS